MIKHAVVATISETIGEKDIVLLTPKDSSHGDYAFHTQQIVGVSNWKLIIGNLEKQGLFEKVEQTGEFINLWVSHTALLQELNTMLQQGEAYGSSDIGTGKTLVVDYSSPNIAKRFGFGHLRSTIIGHALYNLYKFQGWKVIGDNHLGDWGTQFGKMIVAIRMWAQKPVEELSVDEMEQLYVKFHDEAENNPTLDNKAREAFKRLEDGEPEEREIWKQLVKNSLQEFQKIYDVLEVTIDVAHGESFYENTIQDIIKLSKKKGVAKQSQNALVIPFPDESTPPGMLLKNDGATTYFTRDLATIQFRKKKWNPDVILYEVGAEQTLHFKQVFWAAELLGIADRKKLVHIPHGLIRLKEGKMSTRKGRTIKLNDVIQEVITRAKTFNPDPSTAQVVGISALKYNDLKRSVTTGYVFDPHEALSLEGNSGPYLLYTYARTQSVLSRVIASDPDKTSGEHGNLNKIADQELALLRAFFRFPEVVTDAAQKYAPHLLCTYLFDLAQKFSLFYERCPILKAREEQKTSRLALTAATGHILKNGLHLLGIEVLEKI